jgi:hypothetical protein
MLNDGSSKSMMMTMRTGTLEQRHEAVRRFIEITSPKAIDDLWGYLKCTYPHYAEAILEAYMSGIQSYAEAIDLLLSNYPFFITGGIRWLNRVRGPLAIGILLEILQMSENVDTHPRVEIITQALIEMGGSVIPFLLARPPRTRFWRIIYTKVLPKVTELEDILKLIEAYPPRHPVWHMSGAIYREPDIMVEHFRDHKIVKTVLTLLMQNVLEPSPRMREFIFSSVLNNRRIHEHPKLKFLFDTPA